MSTPNENANGVDNGKPAAVSPDSVKDHDDSSATSTTGAKRDIFFIKKGGFAKKQKTKTETAPAVTAQGFQPPKQSTVQIHRIKPVCTSEQADHDESHPIGGFILAPCKNYTDKHLACAVTCPNEGKFAAVKTEFQKTCENAATKTCAVVVNGSVCTLPGSEWKPNCLSFICPESWDFEMNKECVNTIVHPFCADCAPKICRDLKFPFYFTAHALPYVTDACVYVEHEKWGDVIDQDECKGKWNDVFQCIKPELTGSTFAEWGRDNPFNIYNCLWNRGQIPYCVMCQNNMAHWPFIDEQDKQKFRAKMAVEDAARQQVDQNIEEEKNEVQQQAAI